MVEIRRPLYWEGSSKKDFKEFPAPVQKDMGVALFVIQLGGMPESAKPWSGIGPGVYELVEDHHGETFRAVYTGANWRCSTCAACVSEKIQVGHFNASAGRGIDPEAVEGSARPRQPGE